MLQPDHEPPTPTNPTTFLSVAGCTRSFHAAYPLTACTVGVTGAHGQPSTMSRFTQWADVAPLLILFHNRPLRGVRVTMPRDFMYPLHLNAPRVPTVILLPRGLSFCRKFPAHDHAPVVGLLAFPIAHGYTPAEGLWSPLSTAVLPPKDVGLHCPRLYSR